MTALTNAATTKLRPARERSWLEAVLLVTALGAIVLARAGASRGGLDPLGVGAAFGAGLLVLAAVGGATRAGVQRIALSVAVGAVVGVALVAAGMAGPALGGTTVVGGLGRPAAPFVPWALVIAVVAVGEEAVLRGALFDRVLRAGGAPAALLVTTIAFALLHVPLYGWHVVPLDLAVGLVLGGLRLAVGGYVAPAAAHAVADLATWWL